VSELPPYQVELFLRVQKANQSAADFYSRKGFRVVGEESFRVGARDHEALVMRLALATSAEGALRLTAAADACVRDADKPAKLILNAMASRRNLARVRLRQSDMEFFQAFLASYPRLLVAAKRVPVKWRPFHWDADVSTMEGERSAICAYVMESAYLQAYLGGKASRRRGDRF
jgi:hypothetical protein